MHITGFISLRCLTFLASGYLNFYLFITIFTVALKYHGCIKLEFTSDNNSIDKPINYHLMLDVFEHNE